MNQILKYSLLIVAAFQLGACSTMNSSSSGSMQASAENTQMMPTEEGMSQTDNIGGRIAMTMDENDKQKLSRAMDSGIGKSTKWMNGGTGISYTVMPTKKVTIGSNKFCRQYAVTMQKNEQVEKINGTACIADDGAWHPV